MQPNQHAADNPEDGSIRLSLLGGFELRAGDTVFAALAPEAQRLLAFLAVRDRLVSREAVAGTLWSDATGPHSYASLRSALSRLSTLAHQAVVITNTDLILAPHVVVDLREARMLAHRLLAATGIPAAADLEPAAIQLLCADCLPDWYDDWAIIEAEEWRQQRLHALDAAALHLMAAERFSEAITAALAATSAEPLRETAWTTLIRIHLAEGNRSEATRAFQQYRELLERELGIEPAPALAALLADSA